MILPVPWCEEFSFQIEEIFTRIRIVEKEKTRGIGTTKEVTSMASIFTPREGCEQPLIVLIEGEPGVRKTTCCRKQVGSEGANSLDHYIRVNPFRSSLDFRFNSDLCFTRMVRK